MENYILFFILAAVTVLSPGPGVVLTLTNSIRYGASGATAGILGIAVAAFLVAGVAASSLGILLATSALAFTILKFVGAAYLLYLGLRLWFSPAAATAQPGPSSKHWGAQFLEGFTVQITNPKTVFFFMAVFPQFVDLASPYIEQFVLLVTTYSVLVVVIHIAYAHSAGLAKGWLSTEKGARLVNRAGGSAFIGFGTLLAVSEK